MSKEFEAQVQFVQSFYIFREPGAVLRFLERNKFLPPLLVDAYREIRKYFPDSQIFLEVDTDPENRNDQQLVVFIATNLSPKAALQKLKQFDEDWWLDALDRAQRKLCINVEFE